MSCSDFTQDGVLQGDDLIYLTRYVYAFPGPWVTFVGHEVQGSNDRRALARNALATPLPASLYAVNGTRVYLQLPVGQRFNVAVMRLSGEVNVSLVSSITSDFSLQVNEASRVVSIMTHLQGFSGGLLMQRMGQGDLQLDLSQVGSFVQSVDAVGNVTTYNLVEPFLHVVLQLVRGTNVLAISLCSPPEIPMQVSSLRLRFHSATVAGITAVHDSVNIAARENSTGLPGRFIGIVAHDFLPHGTALATVSASQFTVAAEAVEEEARTAGGGRRVDGASRPELHQPRGGIDLGREGGGLRRRPPRLPLGALGGGNVLPLGGGRDQIDRIRTLSKLYLNTYHRDSSEDPIRAHIKATKDSGSWWSVSNAKSARL